MSVCLTGCEPPPFTFLFLPLASYDRVVKETGFNSYFGFVKITLISRYETGYHLGVWGCRFIMIKHCLILKATFQRCIFSVAAAEWNDHVSVCSPNLHYCYLKKKKKKKKVELKGIKTIGHGWIFSVFPGPNPPLKNSQELLGRLRFLPSTFRTNTCNISKYSTVYHWITPTQHCIIHCGIYFWLPSCTPTPTPTADFLWRTRTCLKRGAWGNVLFWHDVSLHFGISQPQWPHFK